MFRKLKPYRKLQPLNVNLRQPTKPGQPILAPSPFVQTPIINLGFDDTFESDYTIAFPEIMARNLKGTSFINMRRIGQPGFLSEAQILEMDAAGWDFQCHTYDHRNMTTMTDEEIIADLELQDNLFLELFGRKPEHFTYPGLYTNERVMDIVRQYRLTGRAVSSYSTHFKEGINTSYKHFNLDAYGAFEAHIQSRGVLFYVYDQIDKINEYRGIGSALLHRLTDDESDLDIYVGLKEHFISMLDYIVLKELETVTVTEMYERVKDVKNNS